MARHLLPIVFVPSLVAQRYIADVRNANAGGQLGAVDRTGWGGSGGLCGCGPSATPPTPLRRGDRGRRGERRAASGERRGHLARASGRRALGEGAGRAAARRVARGRGRGSARARALLAVI